MALRMSTALCNKLHDTNPTKTIFNLGFLKLYTGTPPASADAAATGTLAVTVSNNSTGTGLTWGPTASGGTLTKTSGEVWSGTVAAGGPLTITYFRVVAVGDTGANNTTEPRVQGTVGIGGTDMVVGNPVLSSGATFTINFATLSFVPS